MEDLELYEVAYIIQVVMAKHFQLENINEGSKWTIDKSKQVELLINTFVL